ncbi:hypothetical protein [Streptomyces sp. NPDC018045]|uniref:nSTAND1 domain-containing NTPase n=1 Tax=Streptomyces sp. NPDC018045 TaxID=3365037 RepID=UPI00379241E2
MPRRERPLHDADTPLVRFAADLRRLREKAGSPTYRQLAARAHYSIATLSDAAAGRRLPSLPVALAYVRACGGDVRQWERRWHALAAELATAQGTPRAPHPVGGKPDATPPYTGLAAFRAEDAPRFFGRERLVDEVDRRLRRLRLLALFGASGAGKSSLLRAGLLPHLRATRAQDTVKVFTPGPCPMEECAVQFLPGSSLTLGAVRTDLTADSLGLHRLVRRTLADRPDDSELYLIIDQFEELFTECPQEHERSAFITSLITAAQAPNSRCRIVLGVRADFYAHCTRHPLLVEALRDAQVPVGPMDTDELRRAIVEPARRAGLSVEGALQATLIAHAHGQVGVLPLLSHALLETWHRRRGNTLTLAGFQAAGGFEGALAQTAETLYAALTDEQQSLARQIFVRLTALGDGTEDTKRRIPRGELDDDEATATVLEQATRARLLSMDHDRIEIAHEALIRSWPRLRGWLAHNRDRLRLHRQLTEAAREWESLGRDPGALYRGARLAMAHDLAEDADALTRLERDFLRSSRAAETADLTAARRRARRMRYLAVLQTLLLIAAASTAGYAVHVQHVITGQRNVALAREAAREAIKLRRSDPALAAQLSLAAYRLAPLATTRDGLLGTMAVPLTGHTQSVSTAAFSPDGRTLATGSFDRTVRLWDLTDPQHPTRLATLRNHTDSVGAVTFSPDGRTLVTAGRDRTLRLWDVTDPRRPVQDAVLSGHTDAVFSAVFRPDGRILASGSYDHTIRLWDVADRARPTALATLRGHTLNVKPVAFSPDGRTLASGGDDRTVRLWNLTHPRHPTLTATLTGHRDFVDAVAFSPDGRTLASGSDDRTIRLWNLAPPRPAALLSVLPGHDDVVTSLAFSHTHRTLATSSNDRTARLWDITDPRHPRRQTVLTGHTGAVNTVLFTPGRPLLVTASADHTTQVWDTNLRHAIQRACATARPAISQAQWSRYLPGVDYRPPCGRGDD